VGGVILEQKNYSYWHRSDICSVLAPFPKCAADRFIAAIVPLGITLQFFLVGVGAIKDQGAVDGMSRSGDRREILHGPLYYGIVFILLTTLFWYDSPIGITALMLLCGGDGLADIFGKRFPMRPLPCRKTNPGVVRWPCFLEARYFPSHYCR
jgi:hypothetical protein